MYIIFLNINQILFFKTRLFFLTKWFNRWFKINIEYYLLQEKKIYVSFYLLIYLFI